ncbi:hypothetical protein BDY19DRAFT_904905 [Irpex rosettiformis]|uniref:Uncharacterized protein n=1 Tax=Irpex rosettiformis TaxID=378272 RepID=A0ACB8U8V6_9APHY|nr:hypothetical protein BDY19DRAFT_904905 [Irpex rosettiformis]
MCSRNHLQRLVSLRFKFANRKNELVYVGKAYGALRERSGENPTLLLRKTDESSEESNSMGVSRARTVLVDSLYLRDVHGLRCFSCEKTSIEGSSPSLHTLPDVHAKPSTRVVHADSIRLTRSPARKALKRPSKARLVAVIIRGKVDFSVLTTIKDLTVD